MRYLISKHAQRLLSVPVLALVTGLVACEDTLSTGLEEGDLLGTYEADVFIVTTADGGVIDVANGGGNMQFTLHTGETLSGSLVAPGLAEDGGTLEESFIGTWEFDDLVDNVTLNLVDSQLFTESMELGVADADEGTISGDIQIEGGTEVGGMDISLTFERQP